MSLGARLSQVEAAAAYLEKHDIIARIWRGDHTVWKPDPTEISNRLGWLTVSDMMRKNVPDLEGFSREIRDAGFQHVVLLGMGGSSLGPEVLRRVIGSASGYPEFLVLDSTVPAWIQQVTDSIDPAKTLFLVSSKSGGTVETLSFYKHFRRLVDGALGIERSGESFVAITDAGTSLERLAHDQRFRRVFPNPSDVGGRYSVLSYFGLVPAALIGVSIGTLLDRADSIRKECASCTPVSSNPGAWLGAVIGALGRVGRNKLTLVTSPSIDGFGLWVEQLIAESTGKEGGGIIPVEGEPLLAPGSYGDDRMFVYMRLQGDDGCSTDNAMDLIESSGQPVVRLDLVDRYGLGAEFYRWEFAAAVTGSLLGIHPFDQPDVQGAKDMTERMLKEYQSSGRLPPVGASGSLQELFSQAAPEDYLAIIAYLRQSPELDEALGDLRRKVAERYRIATTLGYGPRYLHSSGQLHKGGPGNGLYLQITADRQITTDRDQDLSIPGESYSFGVLADSQALGDLEALGSSGRRVARLQLEGSVVPEIKRLVDKLD